MVCSDGRTSEDRQGIKRNNRYSSGGLNACYLLKKCGYCSVQIFMENEMLKTAHNGHHFPSVCLQIPLNTWLNAINSFCANYGCFAVIASESELKIPIDCCFVHWREVHVTIP